MEAFPDDDAAELLFVTRRWPNGVVCPLCGCEDVQEGKAHPQMSYRCRACDRLFSVRTGAVMQRSKIGYQGWLIAMHRVLIHGQAKGTLHLEDELGITQKSAWRLVLRIGDALTEETGAG